MSRRCSRCYNKAVVIVEGVTGSGARVADWRCVAHSPPPSFVGRLVLLGVSGVTFRIDAIRQAPSPLDQAMRDRLDTPGCEVR